MPPFVRPGIVERTTLLTRLAIEPVPPLVTVIASAGYGKSTLLRQWADMSPRPSMWLTLDVDDNDPAVLLTYLATALDGVSRLDDGLFQMVAVEQPSIRSIARALGTALSRWPEPGALVIDDVHVLENPSCRDIIAVLVDHVPVGSQIALASRSELPLPTPRLRAEGRVFEITPDDLAVDHTEAMSLLSGAGVELEPAAVHELVDATEGWPVAVYLAGRSIRARGGRGAPHVGHLAGTRDVVEYMHTELLAALPRDTVQFLTRSSVLGRMSGSLCDALLEASGSAERLERLVQSSLLVMPLDDRRRWYRYHHLLRDLLRDELDRREPALAPTLMARAAQWCQANGDLDAAIDYALAAGDTDRAAHILRERMLPVYRTGRSATLTRWFEWLDRNGDMPRYPGVAIGGAWVAALTGRAGAAERWADAAGRANAHSVDGDDRPMQGQAALLRSLLCRDGVDAALDDVTLSESAVPLDNPWRPIVLAMGGVLRLAAGRAEDADSCFIEAIQLAHETGGVGAEAVALGARALIALRRGEQDTAHTLSAQACALIDDARLQDFVTNVFVFAVAARVALVNGDLADAEARVVQAQRLRPQLTYAVPHLAVQSRVELVRTLLGLSDVAGARTVLREIDDILRVRPKLGVLIDEVEQLRTQTANVPAGTIGASSLTAAELRLLPLLQTHLTFREIGERLFVSRHTVKTQAISIYRKLGVSSRSEAMRAASEIGLLPE